MFRHDVWKIIYGRNVYIRLSDVAVFVLLCLFNKANIIYRVLGVFELTAIPRYIGWRRVGMIRLWVYDRGDNWFIAY